ncbi:redoxin domain-containing protein [Candidatus Karelsulcia muelleri]
MNPLIGKKAPNFNATAVLYGNTIVTNFTLEKCLGKYVVLFFYPKDFTFVCPTELHSFQEKQEIFYRKQAKLIAVSIDSEYTHLAWLQISKKQGGIKGVNFPIVSDINKTISYSYGVLSGNWKINKKAELKVEGGELISYRGLFIIDKKGFVRHQLINDFPIGRNVDEVIRIIDALQFVETHGEVCPANWNTGEKGINPTKEGIINYYKKN